MLFNAVIRANVVGLAVIAVSMAALSIYPYMKVVVSMYMEPFKSPTPAVTTDLYAGVAAGLIFLFLLCMGIMPSPLLSLILRGVP